MIRGAVTAHGVSKWSRAAPAIARCTRLGRFPARKRASGAAALHRQRPRLFRRSTAGKTAFPAPPWAYRKGVRHERATIPASSASGAGAFERMPGHSAQASGLPRPCLRCRCYQRQATRLVGQVAGPPRLAASGGIGRIGERLETAAPPFSAPILKLAKHEPADASRSRPVS